MGRVPDTIYDKTFRGGWRKFINRRKDVTKVDTTVVTPSGKKLRSNVELLKFLRENPSYLKEINPREVNFDKNPEHARKCSGTVKKFIQNVEELRSEHDLPPLVKCCKYIFILIICKGAELGTILFFMIYDHSWSFCQTMIYDHSRSYFENLMIGDHDHDWRSFCRSLWKCQ